MQKLTKRTVLYDQHVALGAQMAPFGGFEMPIQYGGILKEHWACRREAAMFDTCHMGEFRLGGPTALSDLERLITSDVAALEPGRCRNGFFCAPDGGVLDDLIVYRMAADAFMVVVNAATQDADAEWVRSNLSASTRFENVSADMGKIDLQGPGAPRVLQSLTATPLATLRYYEHRPLRIDAVDARVSRTGYTGEAGFELYCAAADTVHLWTLLQESGAQPAGLGARDTLRLEVGLPLYGHELAADRNAAESGFERLLSTRKDFIGAAAVRDPARRRQRLVGLMLDGRRSARAGDPILDGEAVVGGVTSGSFSPCLGRAIAMGYVDARCADPGCTLTIDAGRTPLVAHVVQRPFYRDGTVRRAIAELLGENN